VPGACVSEVARRWLARSVRQGSMAPHGAQKAVANLLQLCYSLAFGHRFDGVAPLASPPSRSLNPRGGAARILSSLANNLQMRINHGCRNETGCTSLRAGRRDGLSRPAPARLRRPARVQHLHHDLPHPSSGILAQRGAPLGRRVDRPPRRPPGHRPHPRLRLRLTSPPRRHRVSTQADGASALSASFPSPSRTVTPRSSGRTNAFRSRCRSVHGARIAWRAVG